MSDWHAKDIDDVLRELKSSRNGISEAESSKRLLEFGRNEIKVEKKVSPLKILAKQFAQFLIVILLIASIISILLGELTDALVISVIVIGSALLGFTQEFRAEKAVEALKKMTAAYATVLRDSKELRMPTSDVVRGDIVIVKAGDKIPADARLVDTYNLRIDESPLTGESNSVSKEVETLPSEKILAERVNMLYSGTVATYGRAKGVVVATGMETEFGRIAGFLQTVEEVKTPLERRIGTLGRWIGLSSLLVVSIISLLGILRGNSLIEVFLFAVSLAVAAVPEALPAIVTGSLAVSVRAMARRKAIVKRLPAVETLGSTTIICSDKTGTLTKGEMTVRRIYDGEMFYEVTGVGYEPKGEISDGFDPEKSSLLKIAVLSNDANLVREDGQMDGAWRIDGDPTEGCLIVLGAKAGLEKNMLESQYPRIWEIPFSSERKMMTTIHQHGGDRVAYVKGAPEVILKRCKKISSKLETIELDNMGRKRILEVNREMASSGLRVLAMAFRNLDPQLEDFGTAIEDDLTFAGLVGMIDPPREEAKGAVSICKQAGIRVVMITGDHELTATSVANELGIHRDGAIMTGEELEIVSDDEFESEAEGIEVYARVSPEHKIRIVRALKKRGHIVAMTGDGVNDAPALKGSDIGVAMGITGTDVSKEASDMILLDDNFATLVSAVERGRVTYDNIKKYLVFLLSANGGEILIMLVASLLGFPLPLLPVQILFINLATDGLPAIALGIDPPGRDLMKMKPRDPRESIFRNTKGWIFGVSALFALVSLLVFSFYLGTAGLDKARSMLFATMIIFELAFAFSARSQRFTLIAIGPLSNKYLVMAVASQVFLLVLLLYTPPLQLLFHVMPLTISDWMVVGVAGLSGFLIPEVSKIVTRRIFRRE